MSARRTDVEEAKQWRDLSTQDRKLALALIRGEMFMWRYGPGTNWTPDALPDIKRNYHVLKLAVRELSKGRR